MLAWFGTTFGLLLSLIIVNLVKKLFSPYIPRLNDAHLDLPVVGFAAGLAFFVGILFGVFPALQLSGANLIEYLKSRQMKLISVPPEDNAFSVNCLAVAPGRVIMHTSVSPRLADKLDKSGITVLPVDYDCVELGGGGIHCSTAPLARDPL